MPAPDPTRPAVQDDHKTLVERASEGERPAMEALLECHLPAVRAYVRLNANAVIRAKESCSDIVQSVCREVLEELSKLEYRGEAAFRSWLFKKALSKIRDRMRFYGREKRDVARERPQDSQSGEARYCFSIGTTPSAIAIGSETMKLLEAAYDELTPGQKEVFLLSRLVGMSHKDIAATLGKSEGAIRKLLNRALATLGSIMIEES